MKTTVEELKAYYVKIGGQLDDVKGIDTIPDMIAKITAISGGGSGGSGGAFYVNITEIDPEIIPATGTHNFTMDKTYEEVKSAYDAGNVVLVNVSDFEMIMVANHYDYGYGGLFRATLDDGDMTCTVVFGEETIDDGISYGYDDAIVYFTYDGATSTYSVSEDSPDFNDVYERLRTGRYVSFVCGNQSFFVSGFGDYDGEFIQLTTLSVTSSAGTTATGFDMLNLTWHSDGTVSHFSGTFS